MLSQFNIKTLIGLLGVFISIIIFLCKKLFDLELEMENLRVENQNLKLALEQVLESNNILKKLIEDLPPKPSETPKTDLLKIIGSINPVIVGITAGAVIGLGGLVLLYYGGITPGDIAIKEIAEAIAKNINGGEGSSSILNAITSLDQRIFYFEVNLLESLELIARRIIRLETTRGGERDIPPVE